MPGSAVQVRPQLPNSAPGLCATGGFILWFLSATLGIMANGHTHQTDVVIVGAGPVGLFAVFECGMVRLHCHVIDVLDDAGGQCTALYPEKPIYDIPGFPRIEAAELVVRLRAQAAPFGRSTISASRSRRWRPRAAASGRSPPPRARWCRRGP